MAKLLDRLRTFMASLLLGGAFFGSISLGAYVTVLLTKDPVQTLIDSGNFLGYPVMMLVVLIALFSGPTLLFLIYLAAHMAYKRRTGRNLIEDWDPLG